MKREKEKRRSEMTPIQRIKQSRTEKNEGKYTRQFTRRE